MIVWGVEGRQCAGVERRSRIDSFIVVSLLDGGTTVGAMVVVVVVVVWCCCCWWGRCFVVVRFWLVPCLVVVMDRELINERSVSGIRVKTRKQM